MKNLLNRSRRLPRHADRGINGRSIALRALRGAIEASEEARREWFIFMDEQYRKSKVDLFKMIFALDGTVEYALPESWHEYDPMEMLSMFEEKIDFHRLALAMGYSELEIRKFSRKA